jgi:hypothetical protein
MWFSPGTLVSSTNKTGRHDITEILLKVALIKHNNPTSVYLLTWFNFMTMTVPILKYTDHSYEMESVEIKPVNTMITFKVYEIKIDAEYRFNINKRHKYPKILLVFRRDQMLHVRTINVLLKSIYQVDNRVDTQIR